MQEKKIDKLKEDILKSGILLEVEVSQLLQNDGWLTANQFPYFDERMEKIRAVDVIATKGICLIIECKKATDHPWIFYTASKSDPWPNVILKEGRIKTSTGKEVPPSSFPKSHLLDMNIRAGMIAYVPFQKKDDFFEAKNQVLNALFYTNPKMETEELGFPIYPVIVFDGEMYDFFLDKGELLMKPTDYLHFIASSPISREEFLIDVVRKTYLPNFLKVSNQEIKKGLPGRALLF